MLFNCWFNKLLYIVVTAMMMVMVIMAFHGIDKFNIVMDFVMRGSVEIHSKSNFN